MQHMPCLGWGQHTPPPDTSSDKEVQLTCADSLSVMSASDFFTDPAFDPRLKADGTPSGKMAGTALLSRIRLTLTALGEGLSSAGRMASEEREFGQLLSDELWFGHRYNTCLPSLSVLLW